LAQANEAIRVMKTKEAVKALLLPHEVYPRTFPPLAGGDSPC